MVSLTLVLEKNAEIRRFARGSLPDPSPLEVEYLIERVDELLNLMGRNNVPLYWSEEDVPNVLKVKAILTLLTEELRSFAVEAAFD
ncbi:MAG: hypothetical protein QI197_02440 [Candidatus Korarchaeota archaeon]|nr:hypothetical protein [Candidatus Korarchaeota archaeon]